MSDIEDELLALAGGDSGDEGSGSDSRDASASPPLAKRKESKKGPAKKPKRQARQDDSDDGGEEEAEEGESVSRSPSLSQLSRETFYAGAFTSLTRGQFTILPFTQGCSVHAHPLIIRSSTPGTPNSLESAPMDESESETETSRPRAVPPTADDDNKYPVDGMYVSRAEKAEIMGMREVEREQIIADRISEIERQRQNRLLRQMVTNVENEERKHPKKKRSADTAELEDGHRKTSKARTGKGESAMDSLRRARAEKQRRKEDHERRKDAYSPRGEITMMPIKAMTTLADLERELLRPRQNESCRQRSYGTLNEFDWAGTNSHRCASRRSSNV